MAAGVSVADVHLGGGYSPMVTLTREGRSLTCRVRRRCRKTVSATRSHTHVLSDVTGGAGARTGSHSLVCRLQRRPKPSAVRRGPQAASESVGSYGSLRASPAEPWCLDLAAVMWPASTRNAVCRTAAVSAGSARSPAAQPDAPGREVW